MTHRPSLRRRPSRKHRPATLAPLLAVAALAALPAGVLIGTQFRAAERLHSLEPNLKPILATATTTTDNDSMPVRIELEIGVTGALAAPAWNGTVTAVHVTPGQLINSGDAIVSIDGITRIALVTPEPFYRDLRMRMVGSDVDALQHFLVDRGLLNEMSGRYDYATGAAVKAFREELGETKPPNVFERSLAIWTPNERWPAGKLAIKTGSPAPAAGQTLVDELASITNAVIVDLQDLVLEELDNTWQLTTGELNIVLGPNGQITDQDLRRLDSLALKSAAMSGIKTSSDTAPATLSMTAQVSRVDPADYLLVPTSAIVTQSNGETCLWTSPEPFALSDTSRRMIQVHGAGPSPGTALIFLVDMTEPVLVNPTDILPNPTCHS